MPGASQAGLHSCTPSAGRGALGVPDEAAAGGTTVIADHDSALQTRVKEARAQGGDSSADPEDQPRAMGSVAPPRVVSLRPSESQKFLIWDRLLGRMGPAWFFSDLCFPVVHPLLT